MLTPWWDDYRIDATVTRHFVCSKLIPEEIDRLDRSLGFGTGLTDGTYWEWIDTKAKRIFLILLDLGVPDQIFGLIDDSWDDSDLPIPLDQVEQLALTTSKDERLERKFYQRQFHYLLKPPERGTHTVYADHEVVPIDVVERRPGLSHAVDKVKLPPRPNQPNQFFCRRKVPLSSSNPGCLSPQDFLDLVNASKSVQNDHVVSYWASYTYQGHGYVLYTPFADSNLKSFLNTTPASFKNLPKQTRREMVMNWILCLVDSLSCLHNKRHCHGNIKPSTVLFNNENHIFFSDFNRLSAESLFGPENKSAFDRESYDYAAPEQWFRPTSGPTSPPSRKSTLSSSPEFSIQGSADQKPNTPNAMLNTPNPHLNPQSADIFSLGCVILELLSFLLKRSAKNFATHRSAKHKTPGRGGAVLDASYHKNLGQVESWMGVLAKDAAKKTSESDGGSVFRGVTPILHIVTRMLSANPQDRPPAFEVQQRIYQVLTEFCGIAEPHCVHIHQYSGLDFGFSRIQISNGINPMGDMTPRSPKRLSGGYASPLSPRQLLHARTNSSGGISSNSGSSSGRSDANSFVNSYTQSDAHSYARSETNSYAPSDTGSYAPSDATTETVRDRGPDLGPSLAALRDIQVRGKTRSTGWQSPPPMYAGQSDQPSVY